MTEAYILPLNTTEATLEVVGGKGRSLAEMANAGFDVPGGFYLTTTAYRNFIEANDLQAKIIELARPEIGEYTLSFDAASESIQALIGKPDLSEEMKTELLQSYAALDGENLAVAVRSSANAEDLPNLSFAGQQDTYLNIRGEDALIEAIRNCWASLWTARAISYRHEMGIEQDAVAMAVVVQLMVPSDVSGILFTANPLTGERSEIIINASFGLGEAVVGGHVTPDTYIVDRETLTAKETTIGAKEQKIVSDGDQGTRLEDISDRERGQSSLSEDGLKQLTTVALEVEKQYDNIPQDIEWGISGGRLFLLQSRPITSLPPQPIEVSWEPRPPAVILSRRQIMENISDPCTPLFEELYLGEALETSLDGTKTSSYMVGGGPMFVTLNGYGYQRVDHPFVLEAREKRLAGKRQNAETDAPETEMDAEARKKDAEKIAEETLSKFMAHHLKSNAEMAGPDLELFLADLSPEDRKAFDLWSENSGLEHVADAVTTPESKNPNHRATFASYNRTQINEIQVRGFYDEAKPSITAASEKWRKVNPKTASDEELLRGIHETAIAGGAYWVGSNWVRGGCSASGVSRATDEQLNAFLKDALPDHHFTSGQFLSGFASKTMEMNEQLFEIAKKIRVDDALSELVIITPATRMIKALGAHPDGKPIIEAIDEYLGIYGHLGYNLDFAEPLPLEDPSGLLSMLKTMISNRDYHPKNHEMEAKTKREKAMDEIVQLLEGLQYWQFRFRFWFTSRFYYLREEVMYYLYLAWPPLRALALELGERLTDAGTLSERDHVFYLMTDELKKAIEARKGGTSVLEYKQLAAERFELREARKHLRPPGTLPLDALEDPSLRFKTVEAVNDPNSDTMMGAPVSPGTVTAPASVIESPAEFDKMRPGSILVCVMTNPAWTSLFAHATGLVTDIGGVISHGSIVAREYGIPAVVGTGDSTQRIKHGQMISVDGDAGTVELHENE